MILPLPSLILQLITTAQGKRNEAQELDKDQLQTTMGEAAQRKLMIQSNSQQKSSEILEENPQQQNEIELQKVPTIKLVSQQKPIQLVSQLKSSKTKPKILRMKN